MGNMSVIVSERGEYEVGTTDAPENKRVTIKFGGVTLFVPIAEAADLGVAIIKAASVHEHD